MKKILGILLLVLASTMAFADQAQVTLVATPTGTIGPYVFNVTEPLPNGPTTQQWLVCWSDLNTINIGDSWTADVYTIANVPTGNASPWNESLTQYEEIAWLAAQLLNNPGNADIQNAIWVVANLGGTDSAGVDAWIALAAAGINGYDFSSARFFLPVGGGPNDGPQPLVGFVPEPGSLALLGTGILSVAGAIRRRLSL